MESIIQFKMNTAEYVYIFLEPSQSAFGEFIDND